MKTTEFEALFKKCYSYCMPVIKRKTTDIHLAEDVFLEAISIYWVKKNDGSLKHQKNIPSFVCTTAIRLLLLEQKKLEKVELIEPLSGVDFSIAEIVQKYLNIDNELYDAIENEFFKLGKKCQNLIVAKYIYNYSHKEIAEDFGFKSMEVAKTTTHRCFKKLKDCLTEMGIGRKAIKK